MAERRELTMYLNGEFMPQGQAVTAMKGADFQSSGGFYDTERTFNGEVFKLRQHLERLYDGLNHRGIDPGISLEEMEAASLQVLDANRPVLNTGDEFTITQVVSLDTSHESEGRPGVNVVIYCQPIVFTEYALDYVRGVRVVTPATYGVPSQAGLEAAKGGVQQTFLLMVDSEGNITECKGGNFMFVRDGRIKLPDRGNVLPGVSMATVLELAESLDIGVDEDEYSIGDIYEADEVLVSSTRFCLLPVATINGLRLSDELPGPITRRLLEAWKGLVGIDFVQQALDHLPPEETSGLEDSQGAGS